MILPQYLLLQIFFYFTAIFSLHNIRNIYLIYISKLVYKKNFYSSFLLLSKYFFTLNLNILMLGFLSNINIDNIFYLGDTILKLE